MEFRERAGDRVLPPDDRARARRRRDLRVFFDTAGRRRRRGRASSMSDAKEARPRARERCDARGEADLREASGFAVRQAPHLDEDPRRRAARAHAPLAPGSLFGAKSSTTDNAFLCDAVLQDTSAGRHAAAAGAQHRPAAASACTTMTAGKSFTVSQAWRRGCHDWRAHPRHAMRRGRSRPPSAPALAGRYYDVRG